MANQMKLTGSEDQQVRIARMEPNPGRDAGQIIAELLLSPFEAITGTNFYDPTYTTSLGDNLGEGLGGTANAVGNALGGYFGGPMYGQMQDQLGGMMDGMGVDDQAGGQQMVQSGGRVKKYQTDTTVAPSLPSAPGASTAPASYPYNIQFKQDFNNQQDYETFQKYVKFMMSNYPYRQNLPGYTAPPANTSTGYPIDNIDTSGITPPPFIYEPRPGNNTGGTTMGNVGGTTTMPGNAPGGTGFGGANLGETSFDNTSYETSKLIGTSKGGYDPSKTANQDWQGALSGAAENPMGSIANLGSAIAGIGSEENKRVFNKEEDYKTMYDTEHDHTGASAIAHIGKIWSNKTPDQRAYNRTWEEKENMYKNKSGVGVKMHSAYDMGPMQSAQFGANFGGGTAGYPGNAPGGLGFGSTFTSEPREMPLGMPMQNPMDRQYALNAIAKQGGGLNDWGTKWGQTAEAIGHSVQSVLSDVGGGSDWMGGGGEGMMSMGGEGGGGFNFMDMFNMGGSGEGGATSFMSQNGGRVPSYQTRGQVQPLGADNVYESEQAVKKETDSKKWKEQLKFLKDLESRENNSNKGTLKGANNKLQEWWGTPQEYEVDGKPYLTSPREEFSRIGFEGTGTFTSAGGPGVGVRSYFPYSDPLGVGIETDIDPTGPGGGVLLSNHRLRQAKNSVLEKLGMEKDTSEVMPGFLYGGVEMAGSLPTPFLGLTTSLHDIDKLEKWTDKPENSSYKAVAEGVEKGMGPFLAAWDNPGRLFKDSYLFPKGVHNPLSGSRIGLGGVEGLKGGNIIPDYKYLSLAGGNASVAEEAAELAAEKGWKGKEGLAKARKEILGKFDVGKMIQKTGLPKAMDYLGEKLYGTGSKAGYDRFGKTAAEYIRNFKIPYGNVLSHFTKLLGPTLTMMEGVNILEGAMHQKGQPTGGMFSGEDEDQSASQYGAFPWRQKEYYDTEAKRDKEALENKSKRYGKEYAKKYKISEEEVAEHEKAKFGRLGWDKELRKALDETGNPINKIDFEKNRNMGGYKGYQYGGKILKAQMGMGGGGGQGMMEMLMPGMGMIQKLMGGLGGGGGQDSGQGDGGMDMSGMMEKMQNMDPEQWKALQGMFKDGFSAEGLGNTIGGSAGEGIGGIVGGFMGGGGGAAGGAAGAIAKEYGGEVPKRKGKSPYIATHYYENGGEIMDKTSNLPRDMEGFAMLSEANSDIVNINDGKSHDKGGNRIMVPVNTPTSDGNFETEQVQVEAEKGEAIIINRKNPLSPISKDGDIESVIMASIHLKDNSEETPANMRGKTFAKNATKLGKDRERARKDIKSAVDDITRETAERREFIATIGLENLEKRQQTAKVEREKQDMEDLDILRSNGRGISKNNTYKLPGSKKSKKLSEYQKDLLGLDSRPGEINHLPSAQSGLNTSDADWIKDIFGYESRFGSASGGALPNFGFTGKNPDTNKSWKAFSPDKDKGEKEAIAAFKKHYLSKVPKDLPIEARKRLADYAFNTGRSVEDLLLFASGDISLDEINSNKVFTQEWKDNKDDILKDLKAGNLIPELDQAKHNVYESLGKKRGNDAYEKSHKGRIDMWSNPSPWMSSHTSPNAGSAQGTPVNPNAATASPPPTYNSPYGAMQSPLGSMGAMAEMAPRMLDYMGNRPPEGYAHEPSKTHNYNPTITPTGVNGTGVPASGNNPNYGPNTVISPARNKITPSTSSNDHKWVKESNDPNSPLFTGPETYDMWLQGDPNFVGPPQMGANANTPIPDCPPCKDKSIPKRDAQGNCLPCPPEKFEPAPAQQLDDSFINDYISTVTGLDDRMEDRLKPYPNMYRGFGREGETMRDNMISDLPRYYNMLSKQNSAQGINALEKENKRR